jgi:hypothetical protein
MLRLIVRIGQYYRENRKTLSALLRIAGEYAVPQKAHTVINASSLQSLARQSLGSVPDFHRLG